MKTISAKEAKAEFDVLLTEVEAGESFTITSHGRAVAVLSKVEPAARVLGRFAGQVTIADDFDAPTTFEDLADRVHAIQAEWRSLSPIADPARIRDVEDFYDPRTGLPV